MNIKINVLSDEKKVLLQKQKRFRFFVWQEMSIFLLLCLSFVIVQSIHHMLHFQIQSLENRTVSLEQQQRLQEKNQFERKIQETNSLVDTMKSFQTAHITWSKVVVILEKALPEGVVVEKLVTVDRRVSLAGVADTRDHLLQFQSKLQAASCFSSIKMPLANLFSETALDFQVDFDVNANCLKERKI